MLVKITDTNEMTNTEYTQDLLGHYDKEEESVLKWWDEVITKMNQVDQMVQEYRARFEGVDNVLWEAIKDVYDLDQIPQAEEAALKEAFGEL